MSVPSNAAPVGVDPVSTRRPKADTKRRNALLHDIDAFLEELRGVRVLDPACGSGNFLYVALDRAVWDAYGWPENEIPAEVEEDTILSRLLALNGDRSKVQ